MKDALPDRYRVDRIGTPDPSDAEYFVLDVVHDQHARQVLWMLVRAYRNSNQAHNAGGQSSRADELERLLKDTTEPSMSYIQARNVPTTKKVGRPKSARPR